MVYTKEKMFFFDAEWVPQSETYGLYQIEHPEMAEVFAHQCDKWKGKDPKGWDYSKYWEEKAHFAPEYCKIICISYGYFNKGEFIVQSIYGEDEYKILEPFRTVLDKVYKAGFVLTGYAIKRFDMPWLSKRMMINGIKPHSSISLYGKKPWEVIAFDIPEVWGQGSMGESYTPFEVASTALGVGNSKDDLSGDKVMRAYYDGELERIKNYCELDVIKSKDLTVKILDLMP